MTSWPPPPSSTAGLISHQLSPYLPASNYLQVLGSGAFLLHLPGFTPLPETLAAFHVDSQFPVHLPLRYRLLSWCGTELEFSPGSISWTSSLPTSLPFSSHPSSEPETWGGLGGLPGAVWNSPPPDPRSRAASEPLNTAPCATLCLAQQCSSSWKASPPATFFTLHSLTAILERNTPWCFWAPRIEESADTGLLLYLPLICLQDVGRFA